MEFLEVTRTKTIKIKSNMLSQSENFGGSFYLNSYKKSINWYLKNIIRADYIGEVIIGSTILEILEIISIYSYSISQLSLWNIKDY